MTGVNESYQELVSDEDGRRRGFMKSPVGLGVDSFYNTKGKTSI